jgi:hypothetical protein
MLTKIASIWFNTLTVIIFITFFSFCAQIAFPNTLKAQIGEDPNYEFPILQEKDFQLFIKMIPLMGSENESDFESFIKENNIDEDFIQVLVIKITMNTMAQIIGSTEDLAKEFGQSILFTSSERVLYEKYEDQIVEGLNALMPEEGPQEEPAEE